jgi:hypothetical protein
MSIKCPSKGLTEFMKLIGVLEIQNEISLDEYLLDMVPDCNIYSTSVTAIRGTMFDKSVQFPPVFVSIEKWCIIL